MKTPEPSFVVDVDVRNPGQFFACCGLLELAGRVWWSRDVVGWFCDGRKQFEVYVPQESECFTDLCQKLVSCELSTLTEHERKERASLESQKRERRKNNAELSLLEEERRKLLGSLAREGPVRLGAPFSLTLDWWEHDDAPKTWAGQQEIHKIARAAQEAVQTFDPNWTILQKATVMRKSSEYQKKLSDADAKVEPFYFDARRFTNALKTGFSLNVQKETLSTVAYPAVELLALVGLQRFRPSLNDGKFKFHVWHYPLAACVAASIVGAPHSVIKATPYHFGFAYRDQQKRGKAFQFAKKTIGTKR